jgi:hypothetical protein
VKNHFLKFFLTIMTLTVGERGIAEPIFGVAAGYSAGTLTRDIAEKFTTFTTAGYVGYSFRGFNLHGFFQHADLSYKVGDNSYSGILGQSGVGIGYVFGSSKRGTLAVAVQRPLSSTYVVLSETTGTVNDSSYKHSEMITLQSDSAIQALIGYDLIVYGSGPLKRGENFYLGIRFGYLSQTFDKQATRIKTNNSEIAPVSTGSIDVNYSLKVISLFFTANYDI